VIDAAVSRPAPLPAGLPPHLTEDHSATARQIARSFDVDLDILA
jgi:hypothetical protein